MKTVAEAFVQKIQDGEEFWTTYLLIAQDGTTHDVTDRVVESVDIDEEVEDEQLNVAGGDTFVLLDNADGFVARDDGAGILDGFTSWGQWRLQVKHGPRTAADHPTVFVGIASPEMQHLDGGFTVRLDVLSLSSFADRVSAWDGLESHSFKFNAGIQRLLEELATRMDTHGDLATDIQLPELTSSMRFFQAFDSTIEEAAHRRVEPDRVLPVLQSGSVTKFWLELSRVNKSYIIDWDNSQETITAIALLPWSCDNLNGYLRGRLRHCDFGGTGGARRFWAQADTAIGRVALVDSMHATNGVTMTADVGSGLDSVTAVTASNGDLLLCNDVRVRTAVYQPNGDLYHYTTGRVQRVNKTTGAVTTILEWAAAKYNPPGTETYVGHADMYKTNEIAAVSVTPDGDYVLLVEANSSGDAVAAIVWRVSTASGVRLPLNGVNEFHNYGLGPGSRKHYNIFVKTGVWWGVITQEGDGEVCGVVVDNYGTGLPATAWAIQNRPAIGFGPYDEIGLLEAGHPENSTNEPQEIREPVGWAADELLGNDKFSMLWKSEFGFGCRYSTLLVDQFGQPAFVEDGYAALVSREFNVTATNPAIGERAGGQLGLPSEFSMICVGMGPTATSGPVEENRRLILLIRRPTTSPYVHRVELKGRRVREVMRSLAWAANCNVYFHWSETLAAPELIVRGRRALTSLITDDYQLLNGRRLASWGFVYDGVLLQTGLSQEFRAGDTTSPNARVLSIDDDSISPSFGPTLVEDLYQFFSQPRSQLVVQVRLAAHWEMLDRLRVYLVNDRRTWTTKILKRTVDLENDELLIEAVEHE